MSNETKQDTSCKPLFDRILEKEDKVYDEKMIPLIKEEAKSKFADALREGKKLLVKLEKEDWGNILDIENICVDYLADSELLKKDINCKIEAIKKLYEKMFGETL